ncbi:hypothetical protein ND860_04460 [Leptospira levettii]|uniref:Lipoprotein n=1 Tax=Leptospira levettii TaxID=2023178 RepID=A0AAW5VDY2_9LEPT|nr:hypothetical protein [Leptospira levettii]MCW7464165.1 hypothetical protein [Leptospira levettii]MCW7495766.1 hypothetical protein [Leptospira levettii]MCW7511650.1 hypothetical protein [Leptospira levettii]MCW7515406.1 hypothetical protein [Leptospira levettii]
MVRKLLILSLFCSCRLFTIADPNYVERALQNESDEGFISREFFQIKVEIPVTYREIAGKERREECKKRAFIERESLSLPFLLKIQRQQHRFGEGLDSYSKSLEGKDRQTRLVTNAPQMTTATGTIATTSTTQTVVPQSQQSVGTTSNTNTTPNPTQNLDGVRGIPQTQKKNDRENLHNFAWFFDSLHLYKEDYSDPTKCAFLFRNIQPKLMERVEKTPISDFRKQ